MTQNITFDTWEAEQMRDPEFRVAVEELEIEYQKERRQMNQTEQAAQITELRRQATLGNIETLAALIGNLNNDAIEQRQRIEKLEEQTARDRTQVIADAAAIHVVGSAIYDLQQEVMEQAQHTTPLAAAVKAIFSLQRQVTTLKKDVERLETIALEAVEAEAIANLRTTAIEHVRRIEKLETVLETWMITVNYTAATPPMNEMDVG